MRGAAALLAMLVLAGCASTAPPADDTDLPVAKLSQKIFDVLPVQEVWVAASDGKRMNHAVFRPDTNESVPVFINFSPYWGDTAMSGGDAFSRYMIDEYVPRGFAVVLAGIRGTGHSEGCFQIGGDRELQDMYDVVDFFATRPWSNGHVAAGGKSYDSTTQNGMIAKYPHPALKGIFHVSGITDMYAYNYKGGVPYATGPVFNAYYYMQGTDEYGVSLVGAGGTDDENAESLARLIDDVACTEMPLIQAHGVGSGVTGMKTDYWIERDWTRHIGNSDWNGSIFFVHGLQDWNVKPDHILPWIDNLPEQIRVKGWLHQGGHVYPERTDWNETLLRWLDSELKGIETGFWDEPRWDVQGTDALWRESREWPPARVDIETPFHAADISAITTAEHVFRLEEHTEPNATGHFRITGAPRFHLMITGGNPDPVVTAALFLNDRWVGEGFVRGIYASSLDAPTPVAPTDTFEWDGYPLDLIIGPHDEFKIVFGSGSQQAVVSPSQQAGFVPQSGSVSFAFANATARADQPTEMECFAC